MKYNPRQCRATSCDTEITLKMVFCDRHWSELPQANKTKMMTAFNSEWSVANQPELAWAKAVLEAIKLLELIDAKNNLKARRKNYGKTENFEAAHAATDYSDESVDDEQEDQDTPTDFEPPGEPW